MPEWMDSSLRGVTYILVWALLIVWSIGAPVAGIVVSSYLLLHPAQRILVPLAIFATIYVTIRGARALIWVAERAMRS